MVRWSKLLNSDGSDRRHRVEDELSARTYDVILRDTERYLENT